MESFSDLNLSPELTRSIADLGFEKPSAIQEKALPILLGEPTDFIGIAATGTGKTAAFGIPAVESIDPDLKAVQTLIMCPTRELAMQVAGQINLLGKHKGVRAVGIYGGSSYNDQVRALKHGTAVVVGTPGRLVDLIKQEFLDLSALTTVVLDEADEMISMGFKEDLEFILDQTPAEQSNIWLFSATMSGEVRKVAENYLQSPKQVQASKSQVLSSTVEQLYYHTHESDKPEILCKLIDGAEEFYGIVFCQTKALVCDLTQYLSERGYKVDSLHGDKDQTSRERTMLGFRNRKINILVCTDVASRGIDVKDITHVINYSIPRELENYVHRIGRTARSGKTGFAMSLVTPSHRGLIHRIESMTKSKMKEGKLPSRKEIGTKKVAAILPKFRDQGPSFSRAMELLDESWRSAFSEMSREEIVGRFLSMTFPDLFVDREKVKGPSARAEGDRRNRRRRPRDERRSRPHRGGGNGGGGGGRRRDFRDARPRPRPE